MKHVRSLSELDAEYGTLTEGQRRRTLDRKGGEFDPYNRATCLRRAAKVLFDAQIGFSLCFADLADAVRGYVGAHPSNPFPLWEACMIDWPERDDLMRQVREIMTAEEAPEVPSFSDFDTDMPTMLLNYARLMRERVGRVDLTVHVARSIPPK